MNLSVWIAVRIQKYSLRAARQNWLPAATVVAGTSKNSCQRTLQWAPQADSPKMRLTGAAAARDPLPRAQALGAAVVGHKFTFDPLH